MVRKVTPIMFVGGKPESAVEELVVGGQQAAALDTLARALEVDLFDRPIVATASPSFARTLADWPVKVELDEGEFHFGRRLRELVERYRVSHPFYVGGGSAPLLATSDLAAIAEMVLAEEGTLVANNFYSCDFVAFSPGARIAAIEPPAIDNDLAFLLQRQAGLRNVPLARTVGTQFDVDTPIDLMVLQLHPGIGPHSRRYLDGARLDTSRLRAAMRFFTDATAEVIVAGRVGSHVLAHLETDLACRKRVFSEERGMRASGREARGEVRSLLGFYLESVGPWRFFESLGALGQAAFVDSRVLFSHLGLHPTAADRFHSDLLEAEAIADPFIREFTAAARSAPLPVLLGGHSLVTGGLWTLIDAAWQERDRQLAEQGRMG